MTARSFASHDFEHTREGPCKPPRGGNCALMVGGRLWGVVVGGCPATSPEGLPAKLCARRIRDFGRPGTLRPEAGPARCPRMCAPARSRGRSRPALQRSRPLSAMTAQRQRGRCFRSNCGEVGGREPEFARGEPEGLTGSPKRRRPLPPRGSCDVVELAQPWKSRRFRKYTKTNRGYRAGRQKGETEANSGSRATLPRGGVRRNS